MLFVWSRLLQQHQHSVVACTTGQEGLRAYASHHVDVILVSMVCDEECAGSKLSEPVPARHDLH